MALVGEDGDTMTHPCLSVETYIVLKICRAEIEV